ncbi:hypothetical protein IKF33_00075 [Candidatus Saccharibacteria bacterium]|nr:hypothetical protein [Candidatus Saccharibacteria bacterium]
MIGESFPSGEQTPNEQTNKNQDEEKPLSFDEHMKMDKAMQTAHNTRAAMRPSVKNRGELGENMHWISDAHEKVYDKLMNGENLTGEDTFGILKECLYVDPEEKDDVCELLDKVGITEGEEFDVKYGETLYNQDGKTFEVPFQMSFKNKDGSFTKIAAYGGERSHCDVSHGRGIVVTKGTAEEGNNVGYDGPMKHYSSESPDRTKVIGSYNKESGVHLWDKK